MEVVAIQKVLTPNLYIPSLCKKSIVMRHNLGHSSIGILSHLLTYSFISRARRKLELIWSATTFKLRSVSLICMIMFFCHLIGHGNNIRCKCAVHHIFSQKSNFNKFFNQLENFFASLFVVAFFVKPKHIHSV